jgi:hypothetical protein
MINELNFQDGFVELRNDKINFRIFITMIADELRELLKRTLLNQMASYNLKISKIAIIYLIGVIEYVVAEIIENRVMELENIKEWINLDQELKELFKNFRCDEKISYSTLCYDYSKYIQKLYFITNGVEDVFIDEHLKYYMNELIKYVVQYICLNTRFCQETMLSEKSIAFSIDLIFPHNLKLLALNEGSKAVAKYLLF